MASDIWFVPISAVISLIISYGFFNLSKTLYCKLHCLISMFLLCQLQSGLSLQINFFLIACSTCASFQFLLVATLYNPKHLLLRYFEAVIFTNNHMINFFLILLLAKSILIDKCKVKGDWLHKPEILEPHFFQE